MQLKIEDPSRTAFLICDMQNDFLHARGAYGRAGLTAPDIAALPGRHKTVADAVRAAGGVIVATLFTLVPGRGGEPMISGHLRALRPFLAAGDFAPGSWGQQVIDDLQPVDFAVEKVAYSAFYMSRLEWVLRRADVDRLIVGGIVTNGGVASTVRDAHVRDFATIVLSDGCAAFKPEVHAAAMADLATVSTVATCADAVAGLGA